MKSHIKITILLCISKGKPVGTPDASTFYRVLSQHNVAGMFVAPTAMRALRREVFYCSDCLLENINIYFKHQKPYYLLAAHRAVPELMVLGFGGTVLKCCFKYVVSCT